MINKFSLGHILPKKYINELNHSTLWLDSKGAATIVITLDMRAVLADCISEGTSLCRCISQGPFFLGLFRFEGLEDKDQVSFIFNANSHFDAYGYCQFLDLLLSVEDVDFVFTDTSGVCFDKRTEKLNTLFHEALYTAVGDQAIPQSFGKKYSAWLKSISLDRSPERIWETGKKCGPLYITERVGYDMTWKYKYHGGISI